MTEKPDLDHLRQWIGRSTEASDIVTAQLVKGLRATLFLPIGEPKTGDAAPFTVHWCLAPAVAPASELGPDGHPSRGGFRPPVPLPPPFTLTRCGSSLSPARHQPMRSDTLVKRPPAAIALARSSRSQVSLEPPYMLGW